MFYHLEAQAPACGHEEEEIRMIAPLSLQHFQAAALTACAA